MEINKISKFKILNENHERNKFFCLFIWLDTKLEITENKKDCIMLGELETYIINNYFDYRYYENIDFVNQILKYILCFQKQNKIIVIIIIMSSLEIKNNFYKKYL